MKVLRSLGTAALLPATCRCRNLTAPLPDLIDENAEAAEKIEEGGSGDKHVAMTPSRNRLGAAAAAAAARTSNIGPPLPVASTAPSASATQPTATAAAPKLPTAWTSPSAAEPAATATRTTDAPAAHAADPAISPAFVALTVSPEVPQAPPSAAPVSATRSSPPLPSTLLRGRLAKQRAHAIAVRRAQTPTRVLESESFWTQVCEGRP